MLDLYASVKLVSAYRTKAFARQFLKPPTLTILALVEISRGIPRPVPEASRHRTIPRDRGDVHHPLEYPKHQTRRAKARRNSCVRDLVRSSPRHRYHQRCSRARMDSFSRLNEMRTNYYYSYYRLGRLLSFLRCNYFLPRYCCTPRLVE